MTEANEKAVNGILSMTLKEALGKLTDGLTEAEMDAATALEKRIDKSAYRHDEETGNAFASKLEHRQVAIAALSLAIDAMVHGNF